MVFARRHQAGLDNKIRIPKLAMGAPRQTSGKPKDFLKPSLGAPQLGLRKTYTFLKRALGAPWGGGLIKN